MTCRWTLLLRNACFLNNDINNQHLHLRPVGAPYETAHGMPIGTEKVVQPRMLSEHTPSLHQTRAKDETSSGKNVAQKMSKGTTEKGKDCKSYQCPECTKTYPNPSSLAIHHRTHSTARDYQCNFCSRMYMHPSGLRRHMIRYHPEKGGLPRRMSNAQSKQMQQTGYKCDTCQKGFLRLKCLREHQKYVHSSAGRAVCEECGLDLFGKSALRTHMRAKHLNEDPFACTQCNRVFRYQSSLKRHVRLDHTCDETECHVMKSISQHYVTPNSTMYIFCECVTRLVVFLAKRNPSTYDNRRFADCTQKSTVQSSDMFLLIVDKKAAQINLQSSSGLQSIHGQQLTSLVDSRRNPAYTCELEMITFGGTRSVIQTDQTVNLCKRIEYAGVEFWGSAQMPLDENRE
ncbi:zinc finger protein 192 [Clonorchis sinensis]|uniref:Zinc finger protein 192 n=1 Tax=Clonorchis sinensis TaxID=79923 RepID=G7YV96_CLOSI|nr:zinc finger protein 192 [Clonorchis sinensis]